MRPLVWFRSDLRTADNTALFQACRQASRGVVAAFVVSPAEWRSHDLAPARVDLMLRTLRELSSSLGKLNIPLLVLRAANASDVASLILKAAHQHQCDALFYNREYEIDEARRDAATTTMMERAGIAVHAFTDQVVVAPGQVRTGEGRFFTIFTPFKKAWIAAYDRDGGVPVLPTPRSQPAFAAQASAIPTEVPEFTSTIDPAMWPAGEAHALSLLERFASDRILGYKANRDQPALDATSTLSPYLAIGALSPRQCVARAMQANRDTGRIRNGDSPLDTGHPGITQWITELIWREFYTHIVHGFPRVCLGRAFKPATDSIPWSHDQEHFRAWTEGRTGVPIVDAAMRQLHARGWMHNRLRMIVAMYLTKDLFIDWRWGERYFMRHLIDGYFASNNGGWQWSASTGTDAAPYFRIFNPISQSRANDPEGTFIRRYLPELAHLDNDAIHDPSSLPPLVRSGLNYPDPIVDHRRARERVMAAFAALKEPAGAPVASRRRVP